MRVVPVTIIFVNRGNLKLSLTLMRIAEVALQENTDG